jgi:hypothetical protein
MLWKTGKYLVYRYFFGFPYGYFFSRFKAVSFTNVILLYVLILSNQSCSNNLARCKQSALFKNGWNHCSGWQPINLQNIWQGSEKETWDSNPQIYRILVVYLYYKKKGSKIKMSEDKPEYLSAEALRNRLYHSLCDKGTVDSIKVEIKQTEFTCLKWYDSINRLLCVNTTINKINVYE